MIKIIKFSKPTCAPCQAFQGAWDEIKKEYSDKADFVEVDASTSEGRMLAMEKGARSVPFFVREESGKPDKTLTMTTKTAFVETFLK